MSRVGFERLLERDHRLFADERLVHEHDAGEVIQRSLRTGIGSHGCFAIGRLEPGNEVGDGYVGYLLTTDLNGGSAQIRGLEVSYSQQFSNLQLFGGRLRGFGAFANFTWLETEGNYGTPGASYA